MLTDKKIDICIVIWINALILSVPELSSSNYLICETRKSMSLLSVTNMPFHFTKNFKAVSANRSEYFPSNDSKTKSPSWHWFPFNQHVV